MLEHVVRGKVIKTNSKDLIFLRRVVNILNK